MNSQQKFIFGIIVTVAIALSLMVSSYNIKQKPDGHYQFCVQAVENQTLNCYDRRNYEHSINIHKRNAHNILCMTKSETLFDKCEKKIKHE